MSNSTIESLASSFFYGKKVPIEVLLKPNDAPWLLFPTPIS